MKTGCPLARRSRTVLSLILIFAWAGRAIAADWQATLSNDPPGDFPPPRPLRAKYNFGWSGITAASSDVRFTRGQNQFHLSGTGRTTGLVRALWRFDVTYQAAANAATLRPIETHQVETVRAKKLITHLTFSNAGVTRARTEGPAGSLTTKTRQFNFPDLYDLHSAVLYLRSHPLKERNVHRIVVYPTSSAYLATITVTGREKISVHAGTYKAIKIDLQLNRLGKKLELEPHRKFRRATIWLSDDSDRLILRIEGQIFVGTVFAELQSVKFDKAK